MLINEEKSLVDKLLSFLLSEPESSSRCSFLSDILTKEDFIIFFYIREFGMHSLRLDEDCIKKSLAVNGTKWLDARSILNKKHGPKIDKDYLQSRVENKLVKDNEFVEALTTLVLRRYKELKSIIPEEDFHLDSLLTQMMPYIEDELGKRLLEDLLRVRSIGIYANGKKYTKDNFLEFARDRVDDMINQVSTDLSSTNYIDYVGNTLVESAKTFIKAFEWNIGKYTSVPSAYLGDLMSVIGSPGVGKTRYCIGEVTYPMILAGRNVIYNSCEIQDSKLFALLVAKHIYALYGYKIDAGIIAAILSVGVDVNKKGITIEEYEDRMRLVEGVKDSIRIYKDSPQELKELVLIAYNDLVVSGKYGKVFIFRPADNVFIIENYMPIMKDKIKKLNASAVITDHAGYFTSDMDADKTKIMTLAYQYSKKIAEDKQNPVLVTIVNHIKGTEEGKLKKGEEAAELRAHGTTEATKSADIEIALYQSKEDKRDGLVTMEVLKSRSEENKGDKKYKLVASLDVCDYVSMGDSKQKYVGIE